MMSVRTFLHPTKNHTILIAGLIGIALLAISLQSTTATAGTFWTDDFESGLGSWSAHDGAGPGNIEIVTEEAHSGSHSLRLHFTDLNVGSGPFIDRYGPSTTDMYVRAWIKASPGFQYSGSSTKLSYAPRGDSYPSCLLNAQGGPQIFIQCQGVPNDGSFSHDFIDHASSQAVISQSWHCVEWQVSYGNVGQSNGAVRIWWDDNLVAERTGIPFLSSSADMYLVRMYRERGLGNLYWDDFSVGDSRRGCGDSSPATDPRPAPPGTPRILRITPN